MVPCSTRSSRAGAARSGKMPRQRSFKLQSGRCHSAARFSQEIGNQYVDWQRRCAGVRGAENPRSPLGLDCPRDGADRGAREFPDFRRSSSPHLCLPRLRRHTATTDLWPEQFIMGLLAAGVRAEVAEVKSRVFGAEGNSLAHSCCGGGRLRSNVPHEPKRQRSFSQMTRRETPARSGIVFTCIMTPPKSLMTVRIISRA